MSDSHWLRHIESDELSDVRYAVFGCGNSDWATTFQAIPKLCDGLFEKNGASRLVERGAGDAGKGDFFQVFDDFETKLFEILAKEYSMEKGDSAAPTLQVRTVDADKERATVLRQQDSQLGRVVENRVLTKDGPVKRHIEFELPEGTTARVGDYVAMRIATESGCYIVFGACLSTSRQANQVVGDTDRLRRADAASNHPGSWDPRTGSNYTGNKSSLEKLKEDHAEAVMGQRLSVIQIIEAHPDIDISLGVFLQMLPAMRVRQYSISSSPLWNPSNVTITISVIASPSMSSDAGEPFLGVASTYLASLRPGDRVQMAVRPSSAAFHPPTDPSIPVVMFCAGSGFAPMRGFIQERAAQKATGRQVGKMLLFFGCRSPEIDFLYSDTDLAEWVKNGVVDVRPAFSRSTADSDGRIRKDSADIVAASRNNAVFFTCGSGSVAKSIKATPL
ncbi:FAD-binding domain-containing protein [Mycena latifolia]|nr:FAD-binding domain-containing protein [Mycena latifolia]